MKMLKIMAACALLTIGGQAAAKTTAIKFAKGSLCGSFSGDIKGREFTIYLKNNQAIIIDAQSENAAGLIVKDPKNRRVQIDRYSKYKWGFLTTAKGQHTITLRPIDKNDTYADIEFCAY